MSGITELMRESPTYKKAVLAVAVTAGIGACVYYGYRCATRRGKGGGGGGPEGAPTSRSSSSSKPRKKSGSHQEEPSVEKELLLGKEKAKVVEPIKVIPPSKVESFLPTSSLQRTDELSTSGTFEKISLPPNGSDNFEHLTMSQVHPTTSLTHEEKDKKHEGDVSASSISFLQPESESIASTSILNPSEMFESLSASQAGQSISFITSPVSSAIGTEVESNKDDDDELLSSASGVNLKDENDIVVVETNSDDSSFEKGIEEKPVQGGMAVADFDSSRISPVFGGQSYRRVNVDPSEVFDPAKSHPASVGFKFDANI